MQEKKNNKQTNNGHKGIKKSFTTIRLKVVQRTNKTNFISRKQKSGLPNNIH